MHRSTSGVRRACAVGTTIALIGLTTGLGMVTATAAYADDTVSPVSTSTGQTAPATDAPAVPAAPGEEPADAASTEPAAPASTEPAAPSAEPTEPAAPVATVPAAPTPTTRTKQALQPTVAVSEATIVGDAKVGVTLRADSALTGALDTAWSVGDGPTVSNATSYLVTKADIGKTITVVITAANGDQAVGTTAPVTEDVAFGDGDTTADAPFALEVTAGEEVSRSFAVTAGSGDVSYAVGYTDPEYADPTDPDDAPETYLPDGVELDTKTGLLSGTPYWSGPYDFTIVATNGTSTATEYVELTVDAGQAIGVMASASDQSSEDLFGSGHDSNFWIIEPDGTITTIHQPADVEQEPTITVGGQPTVDQGKSLWIDGSPVDQYGNATVDYDETTGNYPVPTVTSDHATDQVTFDEEQYSTKVTFPHASTHVLTVAEDGLSVSFPVTVNPTAPATTVATVTPVSTKGQLAYTGSDATGALPWALAMLAAGAGLVGLRALRRRTQR